MKSGLLTSIFIVMAPLTFAVTRSQISPQPAVQAIQARISGQCHSEICGQCGCPRNCNSEIRETADILASVTPDSIISGFYGKFPPLALEPLVYSGYRSLGKPVLAPAPFIFEMDPREFAYDKDRYEGILYEGREVEEQQEEGDEILRLTTDSLFTLSPEKMAHDISREAKDFNLIPEWLTTALRAQRIHQDILYNHMVNHPADIDYAYWDLPVPPRLPEEDRSFNAFLASLDLPEIDKAAAVIPEFEQKRINWLHTVGAGLQFSQAYISSNWYQGGNNYLALIFNFNWDVALNTNFHPDKLFTSSLSYRLALNSNPKESLHKYSISQDQFQYNLKMGIKAFQKWFYSFTLQFKTQIFNSYPADSPNLGASFLSPGDLNVGLGMTYNLAAKNNTLKFAASISPFSYNLKTCISDRIDHLPFNIPADRHSNSEIGSNAELTLNWDITSNISWKSRLFLFSNYKYFLADWENTVVFNINKFLSTQIYLHPRFDSSSNASASKWRHWSLKEILSFGLSYTFSTKP